MVEHSNANIPVPALLLADPSPCLRYLVLTKLLSLPAEHPEVVELFHLRELDPLVRDLLVLQNPDGSWRSGEAAKGAQSSALRATSNALLRLGYLGFNSEFGAVRKGAEFLFRHQQPDGSWPLPERTSGGEDEIRGYSMIPLQTALPLRSLAACGYATDLRAEKAYAWLLAQLLEDGAWPTGLASGVHGYVAGYRRLAHSRWGCRSNTTGALHCLALHPKLCHSGEARRGLDLILGRETRETEPIGYAVARIIGAEVARGFFTYYARFDLAEILNLCSRIGAAMNDPRIALLVGFLKSQAGSYGLWDYQTNRVVSHWLSYDLLRSLSQMEESNSWLSAEPVTPFQPYPNRTKRF
jgi:hypothetical protein